MLGSIILNIGIAITGVLPSYFLTGFNLLYFGFWGGFGVSLAGESLGAIVAFLLYRKGFRRFLREKIEKYPRWQQLLDSQGQEAFLLIIYLRMLPFMPSGVVTFGSSVGKVTLGTFAAASSIGKIPALMIEAFSVHQVTQFTLAGKIILFAAGLTGAVYIIRKRLKED